MLHQSHLLLVGVYIRLPVSGSSIVVLILVMIMVPVFLPCWMAELFMLLLMADMVIALFLNMQVAIILYAHCSALYASYGQYVSKGTVIAAVGSTGFSTGPHLHLEWWHNGQYVDPMGLW